MVLDRLHCNLGSPSPGKTVDTGADTWESDTFKTTVHGDVKRRLIARCKQTVLTAIAAMPHRSDRVNYLTTWHTVGIGHLAFSCGTTAEGPALRQQLRPGCTVNGSVYAPASKQRAIGCIDDSIDIQRRYVTLNYFQYLHYSD